MYFSPYRARKPDCFAQTAEILFIFERRGLHVMVIRVAVVHSLLRMIMSFITYRNEAASLGQ